MAGNYTDAPSWRMALDKDGTQGYFKAIDGTLTQLTSAQMTNLNREVPSGATFRFDADTALIYLFPEARDLDAWFIAQVTANNPVPVIKVSTNTTNGVDGTWTTYASAVPNIDQTTPNYRNINSATALGIRGFKVGPYGTNCQMYSVHLYGEITAGQSLDRLLLWHPTLDERVSPAYFDWGDVPRNTTATRDFRVKNMSAAKTANTVRVAMESISDSTPSAPGQHALSLSGGSYLAQQTLATLAPGAISPLLTLRRITPANAQLSLSAFRVFAEAASWT